MDLRRRTLVKTATWRILAVAITWIVVFLYNRDVTESTVVALCANALKSVLYYMHERIWNRFSFGKI